MLAVSAIDSRMIRERERLRWRVCRERRLAGRFDYTDREIDQEVDRRFADLIKRRESAPTQLTLGLDRDERQASAETKTVACRETKSLRINRQAEILRLLDVAGLTGLTREEIANALGCKESGVCAPVLELIRRCEVGQPHKRRGPAGLPQAVLVHSKFLEAGRNAS